MSPFFGRKKNTAQSGLGVPVASARGYNGEAHLYDRMIRLIDKQGFATDVRLALIMSVDLDLPSRANGDLGSITFSYQSLDGGETFEIWIQRHQARAFEALRNELYRRF